VLNISDQQQEVQRTLCFPLISFVLLYAPIIDLLFLQCSGLSMAADYRSW